MGQRLKNIIQEGEGYLVEFKESAKNLDKEICAFANAQGGTIYIGITDSGKVKNIKLTNSLKSGIQSINQSLEPPPKIKLQQFGKIVQIQVMESDNKPVKASHGFYLRVGANSQKLTREEILSFAIQESKIHFDQQLYIEEEATSLYSNRKVEKFRFQAKLDSDLDNLHLLENLNCLKRQNHTTYLTYGGILLFTDEPQKIFPQASITLLLMADESTILEQKILKGSLFDQVEMSFQWLNEKLKKKIKIQTLKREEELEVPAYALRELVVNSVVHRNYFESSSEIIFKVFPDKIEFSNPGNLIPTLNTKTIFGKSYRRNPLIADIFFHAGYIERAGTGLLRVKKTLQENNLPPLTLFEEGPFFIVHLPRQNETLSSEIFNERQFQILTLPKNFFPFSTKDYAKHFQISDRMARLDINELLKHKILKKIKKQRNVLYDKL